MSKITGTGCMLTALVAAYCTANPHNLFEACIAAVGSMGICGEAAYQRLAGAGTSTYRTFIIDEISLMTDEKLRGGIRHEYQ